MRSAAAAVLRKVLPDRLRPIGYLTHLVRSRTKSTVRLGPFAGMRYGARAVGSSYLPKLLGIYERELAPVIEEVCAKNPALIVDVGAAEGYYAVGLALRNPLAAVVAFEAEPVGRTALTRMAELNGVAHRIEIHGYCDPAALQTALEVNQGKPLGTANPMTLLLCDAEGDEGVLLNPAIIPLLKTTSILVEIHEFITPGITEELLGRFAHSHRVERIWQLERSSAEFPFRSLGTMVIPQSYLDWAVSEWRPVRMCWLWMQPHD